MKRKTVLAAAMLLMTGFSASQMVPLGAPADAPPLKWVLQEGNVSKGGINMSYDEIVSLAHPNAPRDAATKGYVDGQIISQTSDDQNLSEVLSQGNVADQDINIDGNSINSFFGSACGENQAVKAVYSNGSYLCGQAGGGLPTVLSISNDANGSVISNLADPSSSQDAATKSYVDSRDSNGTDNQTLGTSGNQITIESGNSVTAPYALNADQLDGVQLSNIDWTDVALAQSDITVADLGSADSNLDMNGNNINDIGGLQSCGANEFVNGNGNCETDTDTDTDNQTLDQVLDLGNSAGNNNIDMNGNNITDSTGGNITFANSIKVHGGVWALNSSQSSGGSSGQSVGNLSQVLAEGNVANQSIDMGGNSISNTGSLDVGGNITNSSGGSVSIGTDLKVHGGSDINGNINLNGNRITSVSDPSNPQDAATKSYVDSQTGGSSFEITGTYYDSGQNCINGEGSVSASAYPSCQDSSAFVVGRGGTSSVDADSASGTSCSDASPSTSRYKIATDWQNRESSSGYSYSDSYDSSGGFTSEEYTSIKVTAKVICAKYN